jgi:hypothetical protein
VRVVDAVSVRALPVSPTLTAIPDFDPARAGIYERVMFEKMRDDLHNALLKLELREQDVGFWPHQCTARTASTVSCQTLPEPSLPWPKINLPANWAYGVPPARRNRPS